MSVYLQPGTSDLDDYFDLPNAGEDESEPDYDQDIPFEGYCRRCGCLLTEADEEAGFCTQCKEPI